MPEEKTWKPLELAKVTAQYLATKGVPEAKLDAEILLCRALGVRSRIELYAGFEAEISPRQLADYREMVRRRAAREPVSRILGEREFMGLAFSVTPSVLSPRPETEHLVEAILEFLQPQKMALPEEPAPEESEPEGEAGMDQALESLLDKYAEDADSDDLDDEPPTQSEPQKEMTLREAARAGAWKKMQAGAAREARNTISSQQSGGEGITVIDLGTGSGCIAASVAAKLPVARVIATDLSEDALRTAQENIRALGLAERVALRRGAWYEACRDGEEFDVIASNPPYLVEGDEEIWPEVKQYDPALSLYGGDDGLDCYRDLAAGAGQRLKRGGKIFLEVGDGQAPFVAELLRNGGLDEIAILKDYAGIERVVVGTKV
jgi:HemK family putative methylases